MKEYLKNNAGNFVFSPYSVKDCFSILYPAAGGTTKDELDRVLGFSETPVEYYKGNDEAQVFNKDSGVSIVNKAYINKDMKDETNADVLSTDNVEFIDMVRDI